MDDLSTDGTYELALELAEQNRWMRVGKTESWYDNRVDRSFTTFRSGTAVLGDRFDLVEKVDADTRLPPWYFEVVSRRFGERGRLGIASGVNASEWTMGHHLRGNNRVYRWDCWKSLDLPSAGIGWDTLDILVAKEKGWNTELYADLVCNHLRARSRDATY